MAANVESDSADADLRDVPRTGSVDGVIACGRLGVDDLEVLVGIGWCGAEIIELIGFWAPNISRCFDSIFGSKICISDVDHRVIHGLVVAVVPDALGGKSCIDALQEVRADVGVALDGLIGNHDGGRLIHVLVVFVVGAEFDLPVVMVWEDDVDVIGRRLGGRGRVGDGFPVGD